MSKALQLITVILLFTALGSTAARADSIACGGATCITSGGYVTEIEALNIDANLFNVTFGTTDSSPAPFNANGEAGDASSAIASALAGLGIVSPTTDQFGNQNFCVDEGNGLCYVYELHVDPGFSWGAAGPAIGIAITLYDDDAVNAGGGYYFPLFQPDVVSTPEPGAATLTLAGLGVIAVLLWKRRQEHRPIGGTP